MAELDGRESVPRFLAAHSGEHTIAGRRVAALAHLCQRHVSQRPRHGPGSRAWCSPFCCASSSGRSSR